MSYDPIPLPHRIKIEKNEVLKVVHDYYDHMSKRHSVRNFSKESVSSEILEKIIETAGRAPSGANQQPWHFVAIKNQEMKAKVRSAAENEEQGILYWERP
jgi:nitroreductase